MKVRAPLRLLAVASVFSCLLAIPGLRAQAAQANFVAVTPTPQNRGQNQQRLPPEKRRSLSNYGPEDVFPGVREQDDERRSSGRSARTARAKASPTPAPTLQPSPMLAAAVVTPTPPAPTLPAIANTAVQQSATGAATPTGLVTAALVIATLLVLAALLYVLSKLKQMLRAGGAG